MSTNVEHYVSYVSYVSYIPYIYPIYTLTCTMESILVLNSTQSRGQDIHTHRNNLSTIYNTLPSRMNGLACGAGRYANTKYLFISIGHRYNNSTDQSTNTSHEYIFRAIEIIHIIETMNQHTQDCKASNEAVI